MMRRLKSLFSLALMSTLALACGEQSTAVSPPSFERPGASSFACFDTESRSFVALDVCPDSHPDGAASETRHLIAFVVQTSRGQIATVDVAARVVLDGDRRVPGFTFERTGEVPVAILTPADDPTYTYVASAGGRSLSAIPTDRLHPDAVDGGLEVQTLMLAGPPTDLVHSPDGAFLYVSIPDLGQLLEVPLESGVMGTPREIMLRRDAALAMATDSGEGDSKVCAEGVTLSAVDAPVASASVIDGDPAPAAIFVDPDGGRLFVADRNLPVVHVLQLGDMGAQVTQAPYDLGARTASVVVTPPVPAGILDESSSASVQFGYAIDRVDGSVLAFDATAGSATEGAVLPVSYAGVRPDRLSLSVAARVLAVLTPDYPGSGCDTAEAVPDALRGVFLSVGTNDGMMRVFDVYDLDAPCRGGEVSPGSATGCGTPPRAEDATVYIRRHRPRIGDEVSAPVSVHGSPALSLNGSIQAVLSDGSTERAGYPSLVPFSGECPSDRVAAFPIGSDEPPLICTLSDPWANPAQQWVATWEGVLPDTAQRVGQFTGTGALAASAQFCDLGVLGADAGSSLPEGYGGDALVITSEPDPERPACAPFAEDAFGVRPRIQFAIASAAQEVLELGEPLGAYTLADAQGCFPSAFTFEVRARGSFTVVGAVTGMRHATVVDMGGACAVDASASDLRRGRAFPGEVFDNEYVSFTVSGFDTDAPPEDDAFSGLGFTISKLPTQLVVDVGSIPTDFYYLSSEQRLYTVDSSRLGLAQISLNPIKLERSFL